MSRSQRRKRPREPHPPTLRRAPDAEPLPVLGVPPGAVLMAIEWRTSLDEQLEAHLLGGRTPGHSGPAKPDRSQLNGTSGLGHERFLGQTQKVYSSGWNMTGSGDHPCPEVVQADLDTGSCG